MSDSIKCIIRKFNLVQIFSFWGPLLEEWIIFEIFDPHWPLRSPKKGQQMWFDKNKRSNWLSDAALCIYAAF